LARTAASIILDLGVFADEIRQVPAPVDGEHPLPHLPGAADEALAAAYARVAEDQVDVIGGVLGQQLIPEPQYPSLIGDVAVMDADPHAGSGVRARHDRGLRDGVRAQVAGRDRASLRRELAGSRPRPEPPPVTTASFPVNESTAPAPPLVTAGYPPRTVFTVRRNDTRCLGLIVPGGSGPVHDGGFQGRRPRSRRPRHGLNRLV